MQPDWAAENLQVIRTLMERSALYRRALAPTTLLAGAMGTLGALGGHRWATGSGGVFFIYWLAVAAVTIAGCLLVVRRQSLKAQEPFWSPPTRRVGQAMLPALAFGLVLGLAGVIGQADEDYLVLIVLVWIGLYGTALHAAGFFMPRGIRFFAWILIAGSAAGLLSLVVMQPDELGLEQANASMGLAFGLSHLAYGLYLLATEKRERTP
jgi:hypothetical protein